MKPNLPRSRFACSYKKHFPNSSAAPLQVSNCKRAQVPSLEEQGSGPHGVESFFSLQQAFFPLGALELERVCFHAYVQGWSDPD